MWGGAFIIGRTSLCDTDEFRRVSMLWGRLRRCIVGILCEFGRRGVRSAAVVLVETRGIATRVRQLRHARLHEGTATGLQKRRQNVLTGSNSKRETAWESGNAKWWYVELRGNWRMHTLVHGDDFRSWAALISVCYSRTDRYLMVLAKLTRTVVWCGIRYRVLHRQPKISVCRYHGISVPSLVFAMLIRQRLPLTRRSPDTQRIQ